MTRRVLVVAAAWCASLVVAALAGRATAPRAREETRTTTRAAEERTATTAATAAAEAHVTRRVTTTTETTRATRAGPAPVRIVRVEEETRDTRSGSELRTVEAARAVAEGRTETVRTPAGSAAGWRLSATAGWRLAAPELRPAFYGAALSRRLFGPVWVSAWGDTDKRAGLGLAVEW